MDDTVLRAHLRVIYGHMKSQQETLDKLTRSLTSLIEVAKAQNPKFADEYDSIFSGSENGPLSPETQHLLEVIDSAIQTLDEQ